jgi:hypothetical protein
MRSGAYFLCTWLAACLVWGDVVGNPLDSLQRSYIRQYQDLAKQQMRQHRIPASITMAQALLESAAGTSPLAKEANNHFGIKCGKGWEGDTILVDDDRPKDCFRKYLHPDSSYADRVQFLSKPRYRFLFDSLAPVDYKGWAYGLKRAGYATDSMYPIRLIQLIERLNLQSLDQASHAVDSSTPNQSPQGLVNTSTVNTSTVNKPSEYLPKLDSLNDSIQVQRAVLEGIIYVTRGGDSPLSVAQKTGIPLFKLQSYNQLDLSLNQFQEGRVLILNRHRYNKLQGSNPR